MKLKLLCTLGPASLHPDVITDLASRGVDLFRINMSHTSLQAIEPIVELVRRHSSVPICLDTEGAQVRCGSLSSDLVLERGQELTLTSKQVLGTVTEVTVRPKAIFDTLRPGALVSIDFDGALLEVADVSVGYASTVVVQGGRIKSNRAITVDPPVTLPPLTDKDMEAIALGLQHGIEHFALSFASGRQTVDLLRSLTSPAAYIIAKIESRAGVRNMDGIISASDAVLIDRGDLSREIPLEYVPFYQKVVVRRANRWNRPVFVATNLLESMVTNGRATVAEVNDIANTLLDGVHGLVLAAETAIGINPLATVDMILRVVRAFERSDLGTLLDDDRVDAINSL